MVYTGVGYLLLLPKVYSQLHSTAILQYVLLVRNLRKLTSERERNPAWKVVPVGTRPTAVHIFVLGIPFEVSQVQNAKHVIFP